MTQDFSFFAPTFQDGRVDIAIGRLVCARCYGHLTKLPDEQTREWRLHCPNCGEAWHGAVILRRTAEKRAQQALGELAEVKRNLPDLFPSPLKGKKAEELLKDLGY